MPTVKPQYMLERLPHIKTGDGAGYTEVDLASLGDSPAPFRIANIAIEPGASSNTDCHAEAEVWYVTSGHGIVRLGDDEREISTGDAIHVGSNMPHQLENTSSETLNVITVWW